jgi:hypothetical protein
MVPHPPPLSPLDLAFFVFSLLIYVAAIRFGTLRVGNEVTVVLPFRLNGLIEASCLFLIPFWFSLYLCHYVKRFTVALATLAAIGVANLYFFGSKFAALFPLVSLIAVASAVRRTELRKIAAVGVVIASFYTVINPYYFRVLITEGRNASLVAAVKESRGTVVEAERGPLMGLRNLAMRITGVYPMQEALTDLGSSDFRVLFTEKIQSPWEYYNFHLHPSTDGSSCATGYFAFFMLLLRDPLVGFFVGLGVQFPVLFGLAVLDRRIAARQPTFQALTGLMLVISLLPFMIGGTFDHMERYFHGSFVVAASYWIAQRKDSHYVRRMAERVKRPTMIVTRKSRRGAPGVRTS